MRASISKSPSKDLRWLQRSSMPKTSLGGRPLKGHSMDKRPETGPLEEKTLNKSFLKKILNMYFLLFLLGDLP